MYKVQGSRYIQAAKDVAVRLSYQMPTSRNAKGIDDERETAHPVLERAVEQQRNGPQPEAVPLIDRIQSRRQVRPADWRRLPLARAQGSFSKTSLALAAWRPAPPYFADKS